MNIDPQIYTARREAFVKQIGEGVAIFPAAPLSIRSHDTEYRYRQDNDLYYLTGFPEPESVCLLSHGPGNVSALRAQKRSLARMRPTPLISSTRSSLST